MVESASPTRGRLKQIVASLLAFAMLVGSGLVYGRLTDRWGTSTALAQAVARLDRVPRSIGDWVSRDARDAEINRKQIERAQIRGYLARNYRNERDGREIMILLVCGRPGPISVHTPDVCYAGAGYEAGSPPMPGTVATGDRRAEFLTARFKKSGALIPETLDICWAWNAWGDWKAPANPRLEFASSPALFKIYLIAGRGGAAAAAPSEPTVDRDFAELILTELNRVLFGAEESSAEAASPSGRPPST
jgi:Protein of unknown function (DUF3485)